MPRVQSLPAGLYRTMRRGCLPTSGNLRIPHGDRLPQDLLRSLEVEMTERSRDEAGVIIKVVDERLCGHRQPVAMDITGLDVREYRCVLLKGHDSEHTDGCGRYWRDLEWLRRRIENGQPKGTIFSMPKVK